VHCEAGLNVPVRGLARHMASFHSSVVLPSSCAYPPGPDSSTVFISLIPAIDEKIGWKSNGYMAARAPMSDVVVLKSAQIEGGRWAENSVDRRIGHFLYA
jgi:hypothetical protein